MLLPANLHAVCFLVAQLGKADREKETMETTGEDSIQNYRYLSLSLYGLLTSPAMAENFLSVAPLAMV